MTEFSLVGGGGRWARPIGLSGGCISGFLCRCGCGQR